MDILSRYTVGIKKLTFCNYYYWLVTYFEIIKAMWLQWPIITYNMWLSKQKISLVCACQYFEKYHFEIQVKKTSLALVLDSFTEHNNS